MVSSPVGGGRSVSSSEGDFENLKDAYDSGGESPVKKAVVDGCPSVVQTQRFEKNSPLFTSPIIFGRAHLEESISQGGYALAEQESYMQPLAIVLVEQGSRRMANFGAQLMENSDLGNRLLKPR